ncbi:Lipid-binding SYLF domain-containing protein [Pustulibacterium marinum]|uniref:Lipid-binding SYLF domain-containing protein n=1 Tax=Pustulibacterium marinum TaxID=1224947 RepID=A0A1I7F320_9FLAO|nr:lipid-binding SYLF domain-containing protein [Pustulibacterium marinum]SFU30499.1 Lipid-binding SYLF domain-containing protein [Pustulibacterium marinum]
MKKLKTVLASALVCLFTANAVAQTSKDQKIMKDAAKAKTTLMAKDAGLESFFDDAAGYVIFPNVGKGGFIIGGATGNGVVYDDGVAIGMADLKKINVGLQAGGQAITEVIFFETEGDLKDFMKGNFQFSAEASAVAVKSGKAVNAKYKDGVAVFAMPKGGLMADASVGGQKFDYESF